MGIDALSNTGLKAYDIAKLPIFIYKNNEESDVPHNLRYLYVPFHKLAWSAQQYLHKLWRGKHSLHWQNHFKRVMLFKDNRKLSRLYNTDRLVYGQFKPRDSAN